MPAGAAGYYQYCTDNVHPQKKKMKRKGHPMSS
jgi:hypothetical protein